jgi:hypothetical protein
MNGRIRVTRGAFAIRYSLFVFSLGFGCTGQGKIQFVSLNTTDIDPPAAKAWAFDAHESCWWMDEFGELNIALKHCERSLILGKLGSVDVGVSLVFHDPPAGRARNYTISHREGRILYRSAIADQRFLPFSGIVSFVMGKDGVARGSFRLWAAPIAQVSILSFLPQRPGNVLCFGTFEAVNDVRRGQVIRQFCESGGYARPAPVKPAATQPVK